MAEMEAAGTAYFEGKYVPTEEAFEEKGYETHRSVFTSRLAKNGGQIIADKSVEMLQRCWAAT